MSGRRGESRMVEVTSSGPRIGSIDFVRGALVLLMVLYHWLAYFVNPDGDFFRYLRFVTPSFIFLTGFMVSHLYLGKQTATPEQLSERLAKRGLKLLALFVLLNVVRQFLIPDARDEVMASGMWSATDIAASFITGNVAVTGTRATAFNILVPIAYLLVLSAVLVSLRRRFGRIFHVTAIMMLIALVVLRLFGQKYTMLDHVLIGVLGAVAGFVPLARIEWLAGRVFVLILIYFTYLILVWQFGQPYLLYVAGVFVCLMLILSVGLRLGYSNLASSVVGLLGRYSLFGYIVQIAILQVLYRMFISGGIDEGDRVSSFVMSFVLTVLAVHLLDKLRSRSVLVDKAYRFVFA